MTFKPKPETRRKTHDKQQSEMHERIAAMTERFRVLANEQGPDSIYAEIYADRLAREPRKNPPQGSRQIMGYIPRLDVGEYLTDFNGRRMPWRVNRIVRKYRDAEGERSAALVLEEMRVSGRVAPGRAGGLLLVDTGFLFRGEQLNPKDSERDQDRSATDEAQYWLDADIAEARRGSDHERDDDEERITHGEDGEPYAEQEDRGDDE